MTLRYIHRAHARLFVCVIMYTRVYIRVYYNVTIKCFAFQKLNRKLYNRFPMDIYLVGIFRALSKSIIGRKYYVTVTAL